jgi:tRNA(Ile2)-agmatinylcytidine synthase
VTVIGLDDTDSREEGMCTTFVAHRVAERLRERGRVERLLLVRLNPAVEHKTRGNAALAVHTDVPADEAFAVAREVVASAAVESDPDTNPGVVVAAGGPEATVGPHDAVVRFARSAVRDHLALADAEALLDNAGFHAEGWGNGRGRIGALAAVGAWAAGLDGDEGPVADGSAAADSTAAPDATTDRVFGDWTHEHVAYRDRERWGTPRDVDADSVFAAADEAYPTVWDTVDRGEDETVCVPHTPGPVLYGIRGDDPGAVSDVATAIESEPVAASETFLTNQGTDAHLRPGRVADALDGRAYRLDGVVASPPETRRGGHVFFDLAGGAALDAAGDASTDATVRDVAAPDATAPTDGAAFPDDAPTLRCAAFEPTKRFRDRVRALRVGDRLTVCGEVSDGTVKLEKVAVRALLTTERVVPDCPACGRRMESAGRGQGYRCRDCSTATDGKVERSLDRALDPGWYEVPPCARRHVAKPLVRGGFDAPTHPER